MVNYQRANLHTKGYVIFANGIYYNLLFSYGQEIPREGLEKYRSFMKRERPQAAISGTTRPLSPPSLFARDPLSPDVRRIRLDMRIFASRIPAPLRQPESREKRLSCKLCRDQGACGSPQRVDLDNNMRRRQGQNEEIAMDVFMNRSANVKFQILVEIALQQPNVRQKDIAAKLNLTNQAISEYFQELRDSGWIAQQGRSKYRVTKEGVAWLLTAYRDIVSYLERASSAINNISTCAAMAGGKIRKGQEVGLAMDRGILLALPEATGPATGMATTSARKGEDVGISEIKGIIPLKKGKVRVLKVPRIDKGGSRAADAERLRAALKPDVRIGCIGIEALVALRKAGKKPDYFYGVQEVAVEVVNSGLDFDTVVTEDYLSSFLSRLGEEDIEYELVDLGPKDLSRPY